jgi:AraC family transcriptional regulator
MSSRPAAERSYRARVARVVAAILEDPAADHRLEDLAALAHFSPFHFHRIYQSVTGETVAATIRRVRLAQAAQRVGRGGRPITEVALDAGYDSPQAFTRAFRQFTGESPRGFQRKLHALDGLPDGPRIVERPAASVMALRHRGPPATIPHTFRRLRAQVDRSAASEWLGVLYGDLQVQPDVRYYAAAALPDDVPAPDAECERLSLPAGPYVCHVLNGPYAQIDAAFAALYALWLPKSGYEPDDRPSLENYLNSPRTHAQAALRTELLIPIRPVHSP